MSDSKKEKMTTRRASAEISDIEADVAYFDARISLIGQDPETPYQKAQLKTYQILEKMLLDTLERKKKEYAPELKKKQS